ncbi:MAG: FprA family A-type flavoprotein [Tissierellia bacterium]|nr:FprA family A-type flavoprotein [Tissierellia bacterium]
MYTNNVKINDHMYYIGVNDRLTQLFENMWPLDHGIAYNAFLIKDEKTALLDTVKETGVETFLAGVRDTLDGRDLDYHVIHHMEPDHSGSIPALLAAYPNVQLVGNAKTKDMLMNFYEISDDNFLVVKEGDTLDLGTMSLTFYMTPMVHWPESMVSYDPHYKVLFSQDAFGGFGCLDGSIFDDEINWDFYESETIRYYVNIIGKFSTQVARAIQKLKALDIEMICPDHGPIWRNNVSKIVDLYDDLSSQKRREGVIIIYGSMYGSTEKMANFIGRALGQEGVKNVRIYDISRTHPSYLLAETWTYNGLILGSPTYNNDMFPLIKSFVSSLEGQKMKGVNMGVFGSYSWSGGGVKGLRAHAEDCKYNLIEPVIEFKSTPKADDYEAALELAKAMAKAIKQ